MTTATHSLDTTSGSTTVAELLARNGARAGRAPHRRSRATTPEGSFGGTLPAFPLPAAAETATQYHYDKTTVSALLEEEPAAAVATAKESRPPRTGLKLAGLAFAGAVLVGGWALAHAQTPQTGGTASGPVPSGTTPESNALQASSPIGAQVVPLAAATPTTTAEIPAPPTQARQPDKGKFSGTLPKTSKAKPKAQTSAPAKAPATASQPTVTMPKIPTPDQWPFNPGGYGPGGGWNGGHGAGHHHR
ncbi:hypothetical protein FHX82_001688 [Amycolatopsis bartoniae]|uniref:Uncharacterized protein n=1 Tax=Amycolatopsis bartoniae TaxID=941986 RepID=A0A8H9IY37_9PSEU|nr:hypothetical protein [Amycolatopsis bartoniae]MBB2934668.1 hypothetical protein [Amycolatopsis bartoniae]TVT09327.1 hypothetical protein FNH07_09190 [Amycolatopsis bartoniae]GHF45680.1 hypothetical protein GCM10017566_18410 [Amycolatopsis bartoniae]